MTKRKIDTTSYNQQLVDSIERLKRVVEEKITPENIHFFSPQFIKRLESVYNHEYDDSGMVNSIDNYKFNSLIRHLKTNKVEYSRYYLSTFLDVNQYNFRIEVPEKFSGRNSFVLPFFGSTITDLDGNIGTRFTSRGRPSKFTESFNIARNESFVRIYGSYVNKVNVDSSYANSINTIIFILFWRYV